ncbi:dbp [Hyphantria cunea granulovirus]|uniref:Dbp n=1 Tax=Hyphantria cunea granulovirus TaxID=307448 RepID=A0AAE6D0C6_9BBAC|nr:dbp [Hyphantria cunea granulovirus]QBQ01621.1 dbp [Hyphantria cunea granulovirus]
MSSTTDLVAVCGDWQNRLLSTLNQQDSTALQCLSQFNTLRNRLTFMNDCLPMHKLGELITFDDQGNIIVDDKLVCKKMMGKQKILYDIGFKKRGGLLHYFVWDRCVVRLCDGQYGNFLSVEGDGYPLFKNTLQKLMGKKFGEDMVKISKIKVFNVPDRDEVASRHDMMHKFFVASADDNVMNASTNNSREPTIVTPMSVEQFDRLFKIEKNKKVGQDVTFLVGAVLKGVEECKSESEITTFNSNNLLADSCFVMNIVPEIFIYCE